MIQVTQQARFSKRSPEGKPAAREGEQRDEARRRTRRRRGERGMAPNHQPREERPEEGKTLHVPSCPPIKLPLKGSHRMVQVGSKSRERERLPLA